MRTILSAPVLIAAIIAAWCYDLPHLAVGNIACSAPSGAMSAIRYEEMFIPKLSDLKFSCVPFVRGVCNAYLCTQFTAIDTEGKHVIGYVWRDIRNEPHARECSPDGGKEGSFYGECPVGTPVATVYRCPWCQPDFHAVADTRGQLKD